MKVIAGELAKKDGEELLIRPKEIYDGAIPSGNSMAAYNMLKLSRITGDQSLEEHARRIFNAFAGEVMLHPSAHSFLLAALQFNIGRIQGNCYSRCPRWLRRVKRAIHFLTSAARLWAERPSSFAKRHAAGARNSAPSFVIF
ncbi:MAG TPA: hypothetical protein GXX35_13510 [Thermoanaerobacterales bacterium]|nr:hypothetical protein [Thermoanaerobacterales bacterium]